MDASDRARKRGADEFKKAFGDPPATQFAEFRFDYVEEAKRHFLDACKLASGTGNPTKWLLAKRSLGVASMRLASFEAFQERKSRERVLFEYREALSHLSECLFHGHPARMEADWLDDVANKVSECCDSALVFILENETNYGKRCSELANLISEPSKQSLTVALIQYMMTDEIIKAAIVADEEGEWHKSFCLCGEAERHIVECSTALGKVSIMYSLYPEFSERYQDLVHTRWTYLARSESAKYISIGDKMRDCLLFENEQLDMDLLWECVDKYRTAMIIASRSYEGAVSHENEAIAASHLGKLFDKVLRAYPAARKLYLHAIHLADALTHQCGAIFFHCEWYQDAKKGIEADNLRNEGFNSEKIAREREPILEKLKPQLDAINAAERSFSGRDYSAHAVLLHIYSKHPPKVENFQFEPASVDKDSTESVKKAVMKAVIHYHPDRSYNKSAGVEWLILCEEITKTLNNCYDRYKC